MYQKKSEYRNGGEGFGVLRFLELKEFSIGRTLFYNGVSSGGRGVNGKEEKKGVDQKLITKMGIILNLKLRETRYLTFLIRF